MTLAELWDMAHGRLRSQREMLVAQAAIVWHLAGEDVDEDMLEEYVRSGSMAGTSDVMAFDADVRAQVVAHWQNQ